MKPNLKGETLQMIAWAIGVFGTCAAIGGTAVYNGHTSPWLALVSVGVGLVISSFILGIVGSYREEVEGKR